MTAPFCLVKVSDSTSTVYERKSPAASVMLIIACPLAVFAVPLSPPLLQEANAQASSMTKAHKAIVVRRVQSSMSITILPLTEWSMVAVMCVRDMHARLTEENERDKAMKGKKRKLCGFFTEGLPSGDQ